ncbi:hypothetical protein BHM03_00017881 [Ensete ventricosum]|nr:hypothetical protein BHM03_00017881 [Ensete ventricosum]
MRKEGVRLRATGQQRRAWLGATGDRWALERSDGPTVGSSGRDGSGKRLGRKKGAVDEGGEEEGATVTWDGPTEKEVTVAARVAVGEVGCGCEGRKVRMRLRLQNQSINHGSGVDFPLNRTHRNPIGSFRFQCGVTLTVEMQRGKSCGRST